MSLKKIRFLKYLLPAAALLVCIAILFLESQTWIVRRWVDDAVYDNWNHYLACEDLPSVAEAERIISENQDVIHQIEVINPGYVGVELDSPCLGKADIVFWYGSHQDRLQIERLIGGGDFFGIPYRLHNR